LSPEVEEAADADGEHRIKLSPDGQGALRQRISLLDSRLATPLRLCSASERSEKETPRAWFRGARSLHAGERASGCPLPDRGGRTTQVWVPHRHRRRRRQSASPLAVHAGHPLSALLNDRVVNYRAQGQTLSLVTPRRSPVTSATLQRMVPSPTSVPRPKGSFRIRTPRSRPKTGTKSVTVVVLVGPTFSMRR
jgi:hypothetical protein